LAEVLHAQDSPAEAGRRSPAATAPALVPASPAGERQWDAAEDGFGLGAALVLAAVAVTGAALAFEALSLGAAGAAWRRGRLRGREDVAGPFWRAQSAFIAERALLRAVADSQPEAVMVFDAEGRCRFANRTARRHAAAEVGSDAGPDGGPAERHRLLNRTVLESGRARLRKLRAPAGDEVRHLRCEHRPIALGADLEAGVLVVERDVTARVAEHRRHRRNQAGLVETVLAVVDQRDPYAAHHAARVGDLAGRMADRLGLEAPMREAARVAGTLITAGKSLVPELMLSHDDRLSSAEREQAQSSLEATVGLMCALEFDGPVIDTLRQLQERVDGRGRPRGLIGDRILPSARIVKAANSFLGLVSRRPGCPGLSDLDALAEMRRCAGTAYDRRAVDALALCLEGTAQAAPGRPVAGQPNRRQHP
jgi:HD-GYP domain-containing protein (c-di-GMP phosphodiesterase class II)